MRKTEEYVYLGVVVSSRVFVGPTATQSNRSLKPNPFWPRQIAHIRGAFITLSHYCKLRWHHFSEYGKVFLVISSWRLRDLVDHHDVVTTIFFFFFRIHLSAPWVQNPM
jgi:hypothetical protein